MQSLTRTLAALTVLFAAVSPLMNTTTADELSDVTAPINVSVTLSDGTELTAMVDAATGDRFLVLRFSSPGILLRRFVGWNHVVEATLNEQSLTANDLRQRLKTMNLDEGVLPVEDTLQSQQDQPSTEFSHPDGDAIGLVQHAVANESMVARLQRVESLDVFAEAANWDNDVALDGIRVTVRPLNAFGEIVPVSGFVTVKLYGHRFKPVGAVRTFPRLGHWSQRIQEPDFRRHGAVYKLKFSGASPDRDRSLSSSALVHARLSIPGRGVFEASNALTTIRPYRPYRDWHELATGRRFLPGENVSPGHSIRLRHRPISLPHWYLTNPDF